VAGKRKGRERGYNYNGQKASRRRGEDKSPAMREREREWGGERKGETR
jgi:hypothetical protein